MYIKISISVAVKIVLKFFFCSLVILGKCRLVGLNEISVMDDFTVFVKFFLISRRLKVLRSRRNLDQILPFFRFRRVAFGNGEISMPA